MKYLGSKTIMTERLILKAQTMKEQKKLWEILMDQNVNKYFLTIPQKFRENLKDWNKQEKFYKDEILKSNDKNVFKWSIFLKETNECIGRVTCHEANDENKNITDPNIRGVSWIINPKYQNYGYGTEAAKAMIDFMFKECEIEEIITSAAICNSFSWKIMEKLGFTRSKETKKVQYTYLDNLTESYIHKLKAKDYLKR